MLLQLSFKGFFKFTTKIIKFTGKIDKVRKQNRGKKVVKVKLGNDRVIAALKVNNLQI
jgi:hypothetical protein